MAKNAWVNSTPANPCVVAIAPSVGDVLIGYCLTDSPGETVNTPAGWNLVGASLGSTYDGAAFGVFWKVAEAGDTSVSFSFAGEHPAIGGVASYEGIDLVTPLDVAPVASASSTGDTTYDLDITPVSNGATLVHVRCVDDGNGNATFAFSTVSGITGDWSTQTDQWSGFYNVALADCVQATAGAITARCVTDQTGGRLAALIALRPAYAGYSLTPVSISAAPALSAPTLGQTHVIDAAGIILAAPTLTAVDFRTFGPAFDPNVFDPNVFGDVPEQTAATAISPVGITAQTPTLGAPSLGQTHVIDAASIIVAPTIGAPAIGQNHTLSLAAIQASTALAALALGQEHKIPTEPIVTSPTVGVGTLGQTHKVDAAPVASVPTVGATSLGQAHKIDAAGVSPAPVLGEPTLGQTHVLSPGAVAAQAPALGASTLTQIHALSPASITVAVPSLSALALGQTHALSAAGVSTSPILGTPSVSTTGADSLDVAGIATTPTLSAPTLGQIHVLSPASITVAAPLLGAPSLSQTHSLPCSPIGVAPTVSAPALAQTHVLIAAPVASTPPTLGAPTLVSAGIVFIDAASIVAGPPTLSVPSLGTAQSSVLLRFTGQVDGSLAFSGKPDGSLAFAGKPDGNLAFS